MRGNPVKAKLARGEHAFGSMFFEFFSPGVPQIAKNAGAEFILFDMEHAGTDVGLMKQMFALCRGLDLVPMVRVPTTQYHFIARMLDLGAMGIMVPMVESKEQAQMIVLSSGRPSGPGRRGHHPRVPASQRGLPATRPSTKPRRRLRPSARAMRCRA